MFKVTLLCITIALNIVILKNDQNSEKLIHQAIDLLFDIIFT